MSSSKPSGTSVVTQSNDPWSEQIPYLKTGFARAQSDVLEKPIQYYPSSTVIPFSEQTEKGLGLTEDRALAGSPLLRSAQTSIEDTLSGKYLGEENPYLQSAIDAASRGTTRNYQKSVLPGISSFASGSGRYGSGMQKSAYDDSQAALASQLGDIASGMSYSNLAQERQNQMAAAGMAPGLAAADYSDIQALLDVGGVREKKAGAELQDDMDRYYHEQTAPQDALAQYLSMVAGGQFGGSQTKTQPIYSNTGMNILGTGVGLASMGGNLFGSGGMFPGGWWSS